MVEYKEANIWIKFKDQLVSLYNGIFNRGITNRKPEVRRVSENIGINEFGKIVRNENARNEFVESLREGVSKNIPQFTPPTNTQSREVSLDDLIKQVTETLTKIIEVEEISGEKASQQLGGEK